MAYVKNTWVDREGVTRYFETIDNDGAKIFTPDYTQITELGTPVNADNMNHIEEGIENHENRITVLEEAGDASNFLNKSQITNCLLEVPQNIKLELNNGTLTLKAGSKVIVPNGAGVFEEKVTTKDLTCSGGTAQGTAKRLIYIPSSLVSVGTIATTSVLSGSEMPANTWRIWYDTTNNIVNRIEATAGQVAYTCGFPLGEVTVVDGVITSIDQVFNGFGYIGSNVWVDKGVKYLIPNGRNEDGTLKNLEVTTEKVTININSGADRNGIYLDNSGKINRIPISSYIYNEQENILYTTNGAVRYSTLIGETTGDIDTFKPKLAFQAVDYNEIKNNIISTCQKSTNGYLKFANNIIIQWGEISVGGNGTAVATLPIAFTNTNYQCSATCNIVSVGDDQNVSIGEKTTTTMKVCNGIGSTRTVMWIAIGY